jgi:hypothetical protein
MKVVFRSLIVAVAIAASIQCFTMCFLAPYLPRVLFRPMVHDSRTVSLPGDAKRVLLNNIDGGVRVETHGRDTIEISADIRAFTESKDDLEIAESYVSTLVQVLAQEDAVSIVTEPDERPAEVELRVKYLLKLPAGTDVSIYGANGNVRVAKGCGRVSIEGHNSDIEVTAAQGPVLAKTTNGRIRVYESGRDATLETINGNIYVHLTEGDLRATTTNGAIVATLLSPRIDQCDLNSKNGGITLAMPASTQARIHGTTNYGGVKSDFLLKGTDGGTTGRTLGGFVGENEACDRITEINMHSLNGNLWLTRTST